MQDIRQIYQATVIEEERSNLELATPGNASLRP